VLGVINPLYTEALAPAVKDHALSPYLMTAKEPEGTISDEILARIESARLLLADLTFEKPNCYYEVGYAHAIGKKVIFSARKDHDPRREDRKTGDPKIHFDLDSHKFSFWEHGQWTILRKELRERIGDWLRLETTASSPSQRRGEIGESEILKYLQNTQTGTRGRVIFQERAIAQELGWNLEDVQFLLSKLTDKGQLESVAGGHSLKSWNRPT
jgi:nucleoside 2-deoxyribosyltransferase